MGQGVGARPSDLSLAGTIVETEAGGLPLTDRGLCTASTITLLGELESKRILSDPPCHSSSKERRQQKVKVRGSGPPIQGTRRSPIKRCGGGSGMHARARVPCAQFVVSHSDLVRALSPWNLDGSH